MRVRLQSPTADEHPRTVTARHRRLSLLRAALGELAGATARERKPPVAWRGPVTHFYAVVEVLRIGSVEYVVARRRPTDEVTIRLLSKRERDALDRLAAGDSNKEIAYQLGVSASTVGVLLWRAATKLGVPREQLRRFWRGVAPSPSGETK